MHDNFKYLIIGAGQAGHSCAAAIRDNDADGSVAIIGGEKIRPYNRPPLSKGILAGQMEPEHAFVQPPTFYREKAIELILGVEATSIDENRRIVTLSDGRPLSFEKLLLATGGRARSLSIPGADLDGIFTLRTMKNSLSIQKASDHAKRVAVIGGGFIGAEVAATLSSRGLPVTMIFPEQRILQRVLPEELSAFLQRLYSERGVEIISGDVPKEFIGDGVLRGVVTEKGKRAECDLAVIGIGIALNTNIACEAGLRSNEDGGLITDERMRTSEENIWAAGDIAAYHDVNFDRRLRLEHYYVAQRQGIAAGNDMAGGDKQYDDLPYFFSGIYNLPLQVHGVFNPEEVIRRGGPEDGSVAYFSFKEGILEGYLTVNRPDSEREIALHLISERRRIETVADYLADETKDLGSV